MPTDTPTTPIPTTRLAPGERIESVTWAALHHYGFMGFVTQESAEQYARLHPTQVETLSYADRERGVTPAGTGWVALRVCITGDDGSSTDTEIIRYPVQVERIDPDLTEEV